MLVQCYISNENNMIPIHVQHELNRIPLKLFLLDGFDCKLKNDCTFEAHFIGDKYSTFISRITNNLLDLHMNLQPRQCSYIYNKLTEFTNALYLGNKDYKEHINNLWTIHSTELRFWVNAFTEEYVPTPYELEALCNLFKIISVNNLCIKVSY